MTRKRKIGVAVAVVAALAVAAAVVAKRRGKPLPEVTVEKVTRGELVSKVTANGRIEAQRKVELSSNVMGQIVNLAVREGDRVEKGDFLLQIDQTQLAASAEGAAAGLRALFAERDAARAALAEARQNFERAESSYRSQLVALSEVDRTRAALQSATANLAASERRIEQARANVAGARDTLSKTRLVAPMSGIVTRLPVEEGEVAVVGTMNNPGTQLMTISDMSVVEAVMEVDETDVPLVEVGQPAVVTLDAYPDKKLAGTVTEVGSSPIQVQGDGGQNNAQAISFEVKIQLADPPADIRPGFSCSAEITTDTRPSTLSVPIQALVIRDPSAAKGPGSEAGDEEGGDDEEQAEAPPPAAASTGGAPQEEEGVYVLDRKEKKVRFARVATGITGDTRIEVTGGVKEGEEVVTGPFRVLREIADGAEVKVQGEDGKGKRGKAGGERD